MKGTKKLSALTILLIVQLVIMSALSLGITKTISSATRDNTVEHMKTLTDERAQIILNYVQNAEKTLTYYSKAQEVKDILARAKELNGSNDILRDKDSADVVAAAQAYTEDYSNDIDALEGLWIGEWTTHCIAHTKAEVVGMVTRKDPTALQQLQNALLNADEDVYNTGMIISPASQKQIVSMYKAVFDSNHQPIGFVGLGIFTEKLIKNLDTLSIKGMENSFYSMVNVQDGKYVFNDNEEMIGTEADNKDIIDICNQVKSSDDVVDGSFIYTKDGEKYVSTYTYMPEYGWLLMLDDPKAEAYTLTSLMRSYLAVFGIAILALMLLFHFINQKQEKVNQKLASTIIKSNKTKESLYTAMFKDVLTEVGNRIAFSMDLDELKDNSETQYFAMFNICDFSNVNTHYGNDTGDWLLVRTVDLLKQVFKNDKIYRTGSDEFIVSIQNNENTTINSVMDAVNDAYRRLTSQQNTPIGKINFSYRAACAKKTGAVNSSVISVLKDVMNRNSLAGVNEVSYTDMDA